MMGINYPLHLNSRDHFCRDETLALIMGIVIVTSWDNLRKEEELMCQRLSSCGGMQSPPLKMGVFCICKGRERWAVRQSRALQQIQGFCMLRGIVGSLNPYIWGAKSWRGGGSFGLWDFISFSRWWPTIMVGVAGIIPIGECKGKKNRSEFLILKS